MEQKQQETQQKNLPKNNTLHTAHAGQSHDIKSVEQTTCCIVGGGPAGVILALLLARQGIPVVLLEAHLDFDRDFRGDTLHPSVMEVMDEIGLADRLLQLPYAKIDQFAIGGSAPQANFKALKTKFPYITMMAQSAFLTFLTEEARRFPCFQLHMGARVEELIEENGQVCGVRYRAQDGWHELRAQLTVGADGRFSWIRKLAGLKAKTYAQPMDILWFRLSRKPDEPQGVMARFARGHALICLNRGTQWQIAYIIGKGTYQQVHAAGLEVLRESIVEAAPEMAERVQELQDWKSISMLSVAADCLLRWYRPGLLLIGDAAHIMSPAGGNGINYAIMDAVATANILSEPLRHGRLSVADLARVQRRRELPTRIIQAIVNGMQKRMLKSVLDPNTSFSLPLFLRLPLFSHFAPRVLGFGIRPEHVKTANVS
jgi:2-polyprenyl-6-methoxyphenol hydroxylase-like FAD-dependent oxidoreductase